MSGWSSDEVVGCEHEAALGRDAVEAVGPRARGEMAENPQGAAETEPIRPQDFGSSFHSRAMPRSFSCTDAQTQGLQGAHCVSHRGEERPAA